MTGFIEKIQATISKVMAQSTLIKIKSLCLNLMGYIKHFYQVIRLRLQKIIMVLTPKQCLGIGIGVMAIILLWIIVGIVHIVSKNEHRPAVIEFETPTVQKSLATRSSILKGNKADIYDDAKLQAEFNAFKSLAHQQFVGLREQLQAMQSSLATLPSTQDLQILQQNLSQPNSALLGKIDDLQNSLQQIVKQTAKKSWVNPGVVESYFRLAAIQGFSDGMRAIIDVDGNQAVLSLNQGCPACRGWRLKEMDFTNQSAVFSKKTDKQTLYVKLDVN